MEPKTKMIPLKNGSIRIISSVTITEEELEKFYEETSGMLFDELAKRNGYIKKESDDCEANQ